MTDVRTHKATQWLGRFGMTCYGVVHLLVAWLALQVVFGESEQADQKGAVGSLAETPLGPVLLWALAIGLLAYAVWQILMIVNGYTWVEKGKKRFLRKFGAGSRAFVAAGLGITAIQIATGSGGGGSSNQATQEWTAKLMAQPFGPWLVGIVALVILGVAVAAIRRGVKKKFLEDLNEAQLPNAAKPLGVAGHSVKGVAYGIIGILVGIAAINAEPGQAAGLDGALKTLQAQTFGSVLLFLVALGFAAYGVYSFAAARAHKG
ncbi:uncharacterized membrane protein YidH (DUF202 family) [Kibdelosporangium banguiense]|uniref:Uncharacterized membrane protein YidH (DUF202 family) n=1 Tax=Kibdelosporangium banguiense TaxID=1365924 RepID=A0ABS4TH36_9PSEU|nr:DUF1206 domain-containing protein [Kibdelosporangium banguiense]MBP2323748.1 uncharacterized membrane protein YidH (DUF202 family) [Kibdelosporangium banguiense]